MSVAALGCLLVLAPNGWTLHALQAVSAAVEPTRPASVRSIPFEVAPSAPESRSAPEGPAADERRAPDASATADPADAVGKAVLSRAMDTDPFRMVGVTWRTDPGIDHVDLRVRVRSDGAWSPWTELHVESENTAVAATVSADTSGVRDGTEPLWVGSATGVQVRVDEVSGGVLRDVRIETVDPGSDPPSAHGVSGAAMAAEPTARPAMVTREQWGADESLRLQMCPQGPTYMPPPEMAVVHHTAGTNNYSRADSNSIVRGIYVYSIRSRGFCDVGYSFMVDRFGTLFEARYGGAEMGVRGGATGGWNTGSFAVSAMGDFSRVAPPAATFEMMARVIAWKLSLAGSDPKGSVTLTGGGANSIYPVGTTRTWPTISAHRDSALTACPGQVLYDMLPQLRERVAQLYVPAPKPFVTDRIAGPDRYATAVELSRSAYQPRVPALAVASGADWPDAVSGGPFAGVLDGPLLLTPADALPDVVATEIQRLKPGHIYVLGGVAAVSEVVARSLKRFAPVSRIAGQDRYGTAAAVAAAAFPAGASVLYLATGSGFADALGAGPLAITASAPLLLTQPRELSVATRAALRSLRPSKVVVVGGEGAVSTSVMRAVRQYAALVERVGGADRYETAALLSRSASDTASAAYIATGADFPDALAGGPVAARTGASLLLASRQCMSRATAVELSRLGVRKRIALGGTSVLSYRSIGGPPCDR